MTNPIDLVLPKLDKVKAAGAGKWKACCPAHPDKNPSLGIKEADDGKVLLHCWAGCSADDITAAIGLTLSDLFPKVGVKIERKGPSRAAIQHEHIVYQIGVNSMMRGNRLNAEDQARFELAKQRLGVK